MGAVGSPPSARPGRQAAEHGAVDDGAVDDRAVDDRAVDDQLGSLRLPPRNPPDFARATGR